MTFSIKRKNVSSSKSYDIPNYKQETNLLQKVMTFSITNKNMSSSKSNDILNYEQEHVFFTK